MMTLTNATFSSNPEGAMSILAGSVCIRNSILWDNQAEEIFVDGADVSIRHSIVQGGKPEGVGDWTDSSGENPLIVDAPGNLRLLSESPAIDAGESSLSDLPDVDLDGNPRIVDGNGDGDAVIDMGAYEYQP